MNQNLFTAVCKGDRNKVKELVNSELAGNTSPNVILNESMIPAIRNIGERFSKHEVFVPEMLIAARAMQAGLDILSPVLAKAGHKALGKVAVGTVKGDLHDIGKNLVSIMLKGAGYEVNDLGVNCPVEKYDAAVQNGATVVLCSALLTTTMTYMKDIVDHFKSNPNVKIIVGGAPVTKDYANSISAHGYGSDAYEAVQLVDSLFKSA
ncbi:MAG TPA: cobalamin-binding protein [Lentisphaeria bacterium]|nr:MAG: hypothetical protein A2X47_00455 [Lentisphaerae bacterium GWF2_38_69]HBM16884.1 cobalamin-binding protein [Lentisphaeria bacterium]